MMIFIFIILFHIQFCKYWVYLYHYIHWIFQIFTSCFCFARLVYIFLIIVTVYVNNCYFWLFSIPELFFQFFSFRKKILNFETISLLSIPSLKTLCLAKISIFSPHAFISQMVGITDLHCKAYLKFTFLYVCIIYITLFSVHIWTLLLYWKHFKLRYIQFCETCYQMFWR